MTRQAKSDRANYRALAVPFPDQAAASEAMQKFIDLVEAARQECKLADVHVIAQVSMMVDGKEKLTGSIAHFGDVMQSIPMLTWALLDAKNEIDTAVIRAMAGER